MKADMLQSLYDWYDGVEEEDVLAIATILDPQFKDKFFSSAEAKTITRQLLITKMSELNVTHVPPPKQKRMIKFKMFLCNFRGVCSMCCWRYTVPEILKLSNV